MPSDAYVPTAADRSRRIVRCVRCRKPFNGLRYPYRNKAGTWWLCPSCFYAKSAL